MGKTFKRIEKQCVKRFELASSVLISVSVLLSSP